MDLRAVFVSVFVFVFVFKGVMSFVDVLEFGIQEYWASFLAECATIKAAGVEMTSRFLENVFPPTLKINFIEV